MSGKKHKLKSQCPVFVGDQMIGYIDYWRVNKPFTFYGIRLIPRVITGKIFKKFGLKGLSKFPKWVELPRFGKLSLRKAIDLCL